MECCIDRDCYAVDFKSSIVGEQTNELEISGCAGFSVTNLGNVPVLIDGNIKVDGGGCSSRFFQNFLNLDYAVNKQLQFLTEGVADPDCRLELIRVYVVQKD